MSEIHLPQNECRARQGKRYGHFGKRVFSEPEFVEAKDLTTKHYIGLLIIETEKPFYTDDKDFWWIIGYYLGDGWLAKRKYDVQLACNDSKLAKLKEHISKEKYNYTVQDNGTCYRLRFADKEIYNFIQQNIGTGCSEKHIPFNIINLPKEQLMQVYEGYLASDGCVINGKHQFSSVNRRMLYEFMLIINKLFHKWACIYKVKTKDKTVIEGRTVNQKDWWLLRFSPVRKKQDHCFVEDGYLWLQFRKREMADITSVYNLEIEADHSYIVQGVISKNCQDLSVAGKREGLAGERIGQTEIPIPTNGKWATAGVAELPQCEIAWRVLDAQYWGVPQRRRRIFLVADFAESRRSAGKILFIESGLPWDSEEIREAGEGTSTGTGTGVETASNGLMSTRGGQSHTVFPQQAYDKFSEGLPLTTLKASGGTYGGGSESLIITKG